LRRLLLIFLLVYSSAFAFDKLSVGYGQDDDSANVYNIAIQKEFDYKLLEGTNNLNLEISAEYINGSNDDMVIISAQPMISYDITKDIYFEIGVGIAYFSEDQLDDKQFGMNFQFKQSIGFGYKFNDKLETTLKYNHYSNADMKKNKNDGLDIVRLQLVYNF